MQLRPTLATLSAVALVGGAWLVALLASQEVQAQQLPVSPAIYNGSATLESGTPVPSGYTIVARIGDEYESKPIEVKDGRYQILIVSPPSQLFIGRTITFHMSGVVANEPDSFSPGKSGPANTRLLFNLTFPSLPEPTPTPTGTPTNTPLPTATPRVAPTLVYSGKIIISGGTASAGAVLVARIGGQEFSAFVDIENDTYRNLVVMTGDPNLIGEEIEFFLSDVKSTVTAIYEGGSGSVELNIIFFGVPTPTPTATQIPPTPTATPVPPTVTPVPPTATPVPPTATPIPPTATPVPPTVTPIPPTATPVPPTATPVPPTATPVPPTATPVPPTATPVPRGGGCLAPIDGPMMAGLPNLLLLVAPVGLVAGLRRFKTPADRRRR